MQEIDPAEIVSGATYEFALATAAYFADYDLPRSGMQILQNVVVHFEMPDPAARYHMPFMLAPNSYSVWASSGPMRPITPALAQTSPGEPWAATSAAATPSTSAASVTSQT